MIAEHGEGAGAAFAIILAFSFSQKESIFDIGDSDSFLCLLHTRSLAFLSKGRRRRRLLLVHSSLSIQFPLSLLLLFY